MATGDALTMESLPNVPSETRNRSPSQSPRRNTRHTKGLSLNFPILLPPQQLFPTSSPTTASPTTALIASPRRKAGSGPSAQHPAQSACRTSNDFLTSVATQERKVLELREELTKADVELTALKKQWATYEADKKQDEVRQFRRMAVPPDELPNPTATASTDQEEERRKRKALAEMSNMNGLARTDSTILSGRGSKRVFEGKHTRALSLLSPASTKPPPGRLIDELVASDENPHNEDSASNQQPGKPSLSHMPTLDGLASPECLHIGFGKTYKNLAGNRRSLEPGAADEFIKQGRQVVDGVREGLWTFLEDIRQATVGNEAANRPTRPQKHMRHGKHPHAMQRKIKTGKTSNTTITKDNSFWSEFGIETPKKNEMTGKESPTIPGAMKSSSVPRSLPILLEGAPGNANEDIWDDWESPSSAKKKTQAEASPLDMDRVPWPVLKKTTPSKLNRTASEMLRKGQDGDDSDARATNVQT